MDKDMKNILKEIKKLKKENNKRDKNNQKINNGPVTINKNVGIGIGSDFKKDEGYLTALSDFRDGLISNVITNVEYSENKKEKDIDIEDLNR